MSRDKEIFHLRWDPASIEASLDEVFRQSVGYAQDRRDWYWKRSGNRKKWAQALRATAIVVTAVGGMLPVVFEILGHVEGAKGTASTSAFSPAWASVVIALGVTALALDRFFGFSTAWIRFVTTATQIETWIREFAYDWEHLRAGWEGKPPSPQQAQHAIRRCAAFVGKVSNAVQEETLRWTEEFKAALATLDQSLKDQAAASQPGVLVVNVTNGDQCKDGWALAIDHLAPEDHQGASGVVNGVYAGLHQIAVSGMIQGRPVHAEAAVRVSAGEIASVAVTLA